MFSVRFLRMFSKRLRSFCCWLVLGRWQGDFDAVVVWCRAHVYHVKRSLVLQVTHEDLALFLQGYTQKLAIDSGGIGPGVPASALAQQCDKAAG